MCFHPIESQKRSQNTKKDHKGPEMTSNERNLTADSVIETVAPVKPVKTKTNWKEVEF